MKVHTLMGKTSGSGKIAVQLILASMRSEDPFKEENEQPQSKNLWELTSSEFTCLMLALFTELPSRYSVLSFLNRRRFGDH